ncbi:hypothetical protein [Methanosalsum natronophilum]|uniref:hypothetical protein n=1 Tax=Methanosalsum natronophilum TaxID=768733 RepID=UPI00216841EF|nr:hypothetical protein [Methanosalsum natronophilum]MCS3924915.1 hypothetical protein [Methanosalsum natronophilum]
MNQKTATIIIFLTFFLIINTIGCIDDVAGGPDIRIDDWRMNEGFGLSQGAYVDVTYTLVNNGNVDGTVDVVIDVERRGITKRTEIVPANTRISDTIRADSSVEGGKVVIRLENQRRV